MPVLHIVSQPAALVDCLHRADPADKVLLIGAAASLAVSYQDRSMAVLADDLGPKEQGSLAPDMEVVSYADFVDLVIACQPVVSWH